MTKFDRLKGQTIAAALMVSVSAGTALADEPFILDSHQLDLVTAGDLITAFEADVDLAADGFNVSNNEGVAQTSSNTSELISIATGIAGGTSLAIGADDDTPPTADVTATVTPAAGTENTVVLSRTISVGRSNAIFAFDAEYAFAVAIDSSVIPRFNN